MSAPTPEDVARAIWRGNNSQYHSCTSERLDELWAEEIAKHRVQQKWLPMARVAIEALRPSREAALRAARAAAIEEAARRLDARANELAATERGYREGGAIEIAVRISAVVNNLRDQAAAIRALGEESAAPREGATS